MPGGQVGCSHLAQSCCIARADTPGSGQGHAYPGSCLPGGPGEAAIPATSVSHSSSTLKHVTHLPGVSAAVLCMDLQLCCV